MKRLNKIAMVLVAVMGMAISGCGSDKSKAPFVDFITFSEDDEFIIYYISPCHNEKIYKTDEAIRKCTDDIWEKTINDVKIIKMKGRHNCKLPAKVKDCPPKDRLDNQSYSFTIKTQFGTFSYDTGDKSTKTEHYGYAPIK